MIETLSVSLSGSALSFLLYENAKNNYGQEGFLLGQLEEKEKRTITDNDQKQVLITRVIKVHACAPCPTMGYFYDNLGRINPAKIKSQLGELSTKVVAWYKYKSMSNLGMTFREKLVHKQLANFFSVPSEFFTCCLLTNQVSDNKAIHSYSQSFVRFNNHIYEHLPLHIVNLSDPINTYRDPECVSDSFAGILKQMSQKNKKPVTDGLTTITHISSALQKETDVIVGNLNEAESVLFHLEREVRELREKAMQKRISGVTAKNNGVDHHINPPTKKTLSKENLNSSSIFETPKKRQLRSSNRTPK